MRHSERGFSLVETVIAVAILSIAALGLIGALSIAGRQTIAPLARDAGQLAARNAALETRAALLYDPAAQTAVLEAPPQSWSGGDATTLSSRVKGTMLEVTATNGQTRVELRYPIQREAPAQGITIDRQGHDVAR